RTRNAWADPGRVTHQHAISAHQCSDCHTGTVQLSAAGRAARTAAHDALCLRCHDLGPSADSPHGVAAPALARLTATRQPARGGPPLALALGAALGRPAALPCASCHREHQGADFDLTRLADDSCQLCHQARFKGFADGHPEFAGYPYTRRTRLQFDHVKHLQEHFTDGRFAAAAPRSCAQCHEPAANGEKMLVRGFEQACARCHEAQIAGQGRAGDPGIIFFRLPGIDVASLAAAGFAIGEWPGLCEGELTPFMRWLLESDEATRAALATLAGTPLADLSHATPAQKAAAARVLWAVKGLLADLVTQGQQVLVRRLGDSAAGATAAVRAGQFSPDVALAAQRAWLPDLLSEVAAWRRGEKIARRAGPAAAGPAGEAKPAADAADPDDLLVELPSDPKVISGAPPVPETPPAPALALDEAEARVVAGGWYRQDDTHALYYRPGGHEDPFLAAWLEGTAGRDAPAARRIFTQLSADGAPGLCLKCHSIDDTPAGAVVNWRGAREQPEIHPFTRFKHAAHFSLMGDRGCMTCHTLAKSADYAGSFGAQRNPAIFHSNFAPIPKATCVTCHQPAKSGESCQQCHNYHTGEIKTLREQAAPLPRLPI
ncbi:MAG TPA: cytochrome c3 family protein, partial [Lacunisphaera sp.]|nr:cytochrome c3 family protein [Lacunisphaera sp.]